MTVHSMIHRSGKVRYNCTTTTTLLSLFDTTTKSYSECMVGHSKMATLDVHVRTPLIV